MATASTGTTTAPVPMARASRLVDDDHDADESDVSDLIDSGSVEKGLGGRDPRELLYLQLVLFTSVDVFFTRFIFIIIIVTIHFRAPCSAFSPPDAR